MNDTLFSFTSGPTFKGESVGQIFNVLWSNMSEQILTTTLLREFHQEWTLKDINLYLASVLVMGLTPQPSVENYFKEDPRGIFGSQWMKETFTAHKWHAMNANIHYDTDACMQQLRQNSQKSWNLQQVLIIDEMIWTFTGKWSGIQHVKGKSHNTRAKIFGITDDSFYLWDFLLYRDKEAHPNLTPTKIVVDFVDNALKECHKSHIVVTDSYYSSLELAEILHQKKLGFLLSCRADRPSYLFSQTLHDQISAKGDYASIHNRYFYAMSVKDKAKVNLLSNVMNLNKTIINSQTNQTLPLGFCWYQKWLGDLDHFDRWLHLYLTQHRNIKWTQALLSTLLKIAVNNTHHCNIFWLWYHLQRNYWTSHWSFEKFSFSLRRDKQTHWRNKKKCWTTFCWQDGQCEKMCLLFEKEGEKQYQSKLFGMQSTFAQWLL